MNKNNKSKDKSKIEGVDNKELTAFVLIIGVIVILIMFEIFFFQGRPEVAEESIIINEKLQEMESVTVESEQKAVYHVLNDIISKMNNKQYEDLYSMLKDDYRDYYFADYESFENFINRYAAYEYYPQYSSYYRNGDLYYIMVDFLQNKYTRQDLLTLKVTKVDTLVLEDVGDGNFKFAMNGFVENIQHNKSKTVDGVTFTLHESVRNIETMETTVIVKNDSEKSFSMSTLNIQPNIFGGNTSKLSVTNVLNLDPGEVGTLSIEYYLQYNSGKEFNGVTITGASFADGTVIEDITLIR